jgi:predicted alpha/beta-fold hydrolase
MGRFLPGPRVRLPFDEREVDLGDGDRVTVLESIPPNWVPDSPAAILIHGLSGCARSPYVVRVASRLFSLGVRVVRMNLRGAGSGFGLARGIYHAGRTQDVRRVVEWLGSRAPGVSIGLVGFSLGGNLVLKLAAEAAEDPLAGLESVIAANPPIDLAACSRRIQIPGNRIYERNFVRQLVADIRKLHAAFPELGPADLTQVRTIFDFDDIYVAPRNGFNDGADYYARSSAGPRIPEIGVPGLVVHAVDDPFVPVGPFLSAKFPKDLELELVPGGGHLGYFSRRCWNGDHRWLDSRIVAWLTSRWGANATRSSGVSS